MKNKGVETMKTFTLFCIENLIKIIQEKRALQMDISTLNLQTTDMIKLDEKQVQLMRKAWEDELNLFFVHVNTYGFIYTNPFSNFKKFVLEAIDFGMTYLLRQSPTAKKHWDYPIDLVDIADQLIKEVSAVECINFHVELEIIDYEVHRSEFLEFGDRNSFKRVYEAGDGIYTLFSKEGPTFNIKELPLYNPELASNLMLKESEYHRLLILASLAHGHFNDLLELGNSYNFMSWSVEEFKERAKIVSRFYGRGNLTFEGQVDQVKVEAFHHFTLIVDGQTFMHMIVDTDNELRAFPHILLNRGKIKERKVFLNYRDQESYKHIFVDERPYHYSFDKNDGQTFDVRDLPFYNKEMIEITKEIGFTIEEYHSYLILASILNGHLDKYMESPFQLIIDVRDFPTLDSIDSRLKVIMSISGVGNWNNYNGGSIDVVDIFSYSMVNLILDDDLLLEYDLDSDYSNVDKDMQIKTMVDIIFNLNGQLIDHY